MCLQLHPSLSAPEYLHLTIARHSAGYHFSVLNTALETISHDLSFTVKGGGAIVTSALLLGGAIGALSAGQTADFLGLKKAVLFNNVLLALGCLLGALAQGINGLTVGT